MLEQSSSSATSATIRSQRAVLYSIDAPTSVRSLQPAPHFDWAGGDNTHTTRYEQGSSEAGQYNQTGYDQSQDSRQGFGHHSQYGRHMILQGNGSSDYYPDVHDYMPRTAPLFYERPASPRAQHPRITLHGPHDHWPRSSSQPNTRSSATVEARRPAMINTYLWPSPPPSRLHQSRSESAFQDESDIQLFVAATSGLSPDEFRRNSSSSVGLQEGSDQQPDEEETPRTNSASSQLALLPQPTPMTLWRSATGVPCRNQEQNNFMLQPDTSDDYDNDILPDYAQSQAEMESQARQEAMRRAEYLKSSWRQGRGW